MTKGWDFGVSYFTISHCENKVRHGTCMFYLWYSNWTICMLQMGILKDWMVLAGLTSRATVTHWHFLGSKGWFSRVNAERILWHAELWFRCVGSLTFWSTFIHVVCLCPRIISTLYSEVLARSLEFASTRRCRDRRLFASFGWAAGNSIAQPTTKSILIDFFVRPFPHHTHRCEGWIQNSLNFIMFLLNYIYIYICMYV